jgi:hypothetical protein
VPTGGLEGQVIVKLSNTDYDTSWDYVESVYLQIQNDEGSTLSAGTPVYAKGISGSSILVGKADANDSAKMPAIGVLLEETTDGSSGEIITAGLFNKTISGLTGVSVGDTVFVSNTGALTTTKPTASTDLLQNIGVVLQTNGSNIQKMKVSAIDRTNDIPNLDSGKFFIGGTTSQVSAYTLPTTNGTTGQILQTDGAGAVTFVDFVAIGVKIEKTSNTDYDYRGDVVYFGATTSMTQGDLYYFNSSGNWAQADANAVASSGSVLLAIALGTTSDTDGMLLRGTFTMEATAIDGTEATGDELYVGTTAGHVTSDVSAYTTGDVVRVVGYCLDGTNGQIWFNPSNDWIELS